MSMILDALSRAEQERKESSEGLFDKGTYTKPTAIKNDKVKNWILLALVINMLLLSIFAVIYFWKAGINKDDLTVVNVSKPQVEAVVVEVKKEQVSVHTEVKPVKKMAKPAAAKPVVKQKSSLQEEAIVQRERIISKEEAIGKTTTSTPRVTVATEPFTTEIISLPVPATFNEKKNNNQYLSINDLTAAEKSKLRAYEINVHVYDNEADERFVLVNMKKYKQGDRLPGGGPIIDEITPEGLIMDYAQGKVLLERN